MKIPTKKSKKMRVVKKILKWIFILVALYMVYIVGFVYFTQAIPIHPPKLTTAPQGVVVFTGTKARLMEGFRLIQKYPSTYLLVSGVNEGTSPSYLMKVAGVPCCPRDDHITLDYRAQDTIQNAIETARWSASNNLDTICLVTSNWHMPRSLLELNHYAPNIKIMPHPVIANSFYDNTWWHDKVMMSQIFREYNKFILAWLRFKVEGILA